MKSGKMCVSMTEDLTEHTDGKYYCLFHLPERKEKKKSLKRNLRKESKKSAGKLKTCSETTDGRTTVIKDANI